MQKRYTYFHVLFLCWKAATVKKITPTMKDLGKNTVKPWITNVILYIQTHYNCETKFFPP